MLLSKRAETEAVVLAVLLERPHDRRRSSGLGGAAFHRAVTERGGHLTVLAEAVASLRGQGIDVNSWKQGNQSLWRLKPPSSFSPQRQPHWAGGDPIEQWLQSWGMVLDRGGELVGGVRAAQLHRALASPDEAPRPWDPPPPLAAHERALRS